MHDIVEFLRRHAPFDDLDESALEELSENVEVEYHPAGETILRKGEAPAEEVRVVRRGSAELVDDGRVADTLGEGELFGHPSMLSGLPAGFEVRAGEDTLCYRLPSDAVVPLLARPAGLRYLTRSLIDRGQARGAATRPDFDPAQEPVAGLIHDSPLICEPETSVRETARRMSEQQAGAALIRLGNGRLGIVTDRDLRDSVVAGGLGADAPVSEVMTAPAYTVTPDRTSADVMIEMLDRDIHQVPVVWPHGEVLGLLTDRDLLAAQARAPFSLRRAIDEARDGTALRRVAAQLRPELIALHDAGVAPGQIASIITVVADAITRRSIELAIADLGRPPVPFSWLALGGFGRGEVAPSSDIDTALVWDGSTADEGGYMRRMGARAVDELAACGFAPDPHGVTAAESLFDRSFADWRTEVHRAITHPGEDKALVFISLLADARRVHRLGDVRDPLEELRHVWHRENLVRLLLRLALAHRPPTGLGRFRTAPRDFVVKPSGEHRGSLDIKEVGLMPVVGIARYAALAAGVRLTSTPARLRAAATAGKLDGNHARTLGEAYELFTRLRMEHQLEQIRTGAEPDDFIAPELLNLVTRGYLREAFQAVATVQRSLRGKLTWH